MVVNSPRAWAYERGAKRSCPHRSKVRGIMGAVRPPSFASLWWCGPPRLARMPFPGRAHVLDKNTSGFDSQTQPFVGCGGWQFSGPLEAG